MKIIKTAFTLTCADRTFDKTLFAPAIETAEQKRQRLKRLSEEAKKLIKIEKEED